MKKIFATSLLLLNILPVFAYVRDDTDSGGGAGGAILFFVILIIVFIAEMKSQNKNR